MNVPWPFVSRSRRFGRLGLEREVGAVDDLAGPSRPSTGLTPVSMSATSTPCAGVAGVPPRRRAGVRGRVDHRVHVGRGVVAGGQRGRGRDGGRDAGRRRSASRRVRPDAEKSRLQPRSAGSASEAAEPPSGRSTCSHRCHLRVRSMCGAWQPGGLRERAPGRSLALRPRLSTGLPSLQTVRRQPIWLPSCSRDHRRGRAVRPMGRKSCSVRAGTENCPAAGASAQPASTIRSGCPSSQRLSRTSGRRSGRCRGPAASRSTAGSSGRAK